MRVVNHDIVPVEQLEKGIKTLTHNWRNLLNGINLQVISAGVADDAAECEADLATAGRLIVSATQEVASLSRRLMPPEILPIPYPTEHLLEDAIALLGRRQPPISNRLDWQRKLGGGNAVVDFAFFTEALGEVLENSLRYFPMEARLIISVTEESGMLTFSWSEKKESPVSPEAWGKTPFLSTERGHLGLGLYFAQRVLKQHGGFLEFSFSPSTGLLQTKLGIPLETT